MFEQMDRMYKLAVWDNDGRQYLPLFGYDGMVEAYAPAWEAIEVWARVWGVEVI